MAKEKRLTGAVRTLSLRFTPSDVSMMTELANIEGTTVSAIVRRAVRRELQLAGVTETGPTVQPLQAGR